MSNAMRFGKRTLAGVAAGALGAGLLTVLAAAPAQAATPAVVEFLYPSATVVGSNLKIDDTMVGIPVYVTDSAGDDVVSADMTGYKVEVTITRPSTVPGASGDDSVLLSVRTASGTQATSIDTANLTSLEDVTVRPASGKFSGVVGTTQLTWDSVTNELGYTGTYTLNARLYSTANGAVIDTATMPFKVVTSAAPGVAQLVFTNQSGNTLNQIAGTVTGSVGSYNTNTAYTDDTFYVTPVDSAGGPVWIQDDSLGISFSASTTSGTWNNGRVSGFGGGLGTGTISIGDDDVTWANVSSSNVTATYTPAASTAVANALPAAIGGATAIDPAPVVVLGNTVKFDTNPTSTTNKVYQVPPGTTSLTLNYTTAEAYDDTFMVYNATSSKVGGTVTPSGARVRLIADAGTATLTLNSTAATKDETVTVYSGSYSGNGTLATTTIAFRAPTATLASAAPIAKVATSSPIVGTITDQYGAALPGTWAISLKDASGGCSATSIATTTASAAGAFTLDIPAAYALSSAGSKTFGICASNGFSATSGTQAVTYTATGGVTSLTATAEVSTGTTASVPVVRTPPNGVAVLTTLTTTTVPSTQVALTSANINTANTATAFKVNAVVNPRTAVTFSGTDGVLFTTATTGSVLFSNGTKTATVTAGASAPFTATVSVFATKPGKHTVTATAGTSTSTVTFWAGVAAGSGRFMVADPTEIKLAPNEFKAATVKVTDIYGNPVPDDTSVVVSLAGGGTTSPAQPIAAGTLTTSAAGVATVYYTAPLGTGTGLLSWSSANFQTGTIPGVNPVVRTATTTIVVSTGGGGDKTIVIVGERGTVSGKPGIIVDGATTGLEAGKTVIPYVRFPGGEYTQGTARPKISAAGDFEWSRKTGKKAYVYFTNDDGAVTSNRIIIAAS